MKNNKQYLRYGIVAALVVFLLSTALLVISLWEDSQGFYPETEGLSETITYEGVEYVLKKDVQTLLILGLDKFDESIQNDAYTNDQQADFVLLMVIDNANKTCAAIHINRDTMADMNILGVAGERVQTVNQQLALAHTYGNGKEVSCRNTAEAVSRLLMNVRVDHYASLTMDAVPVLNDLVGGVELMVKDDFSDVDPSLVQGATIRLTGEQALRYIRSRYGMDDSSNNARMLRQRQYMEALYQQATAYLENGGDISTEDSLQIADYIVSDQSLEGLRSLFKKISDYEFINIHALEGTIIRGEKYMEFYPDVDALRKMVIDLFYEKKN